MTGQKWKELCIRTLRLYTLLVTLITVLMIILGILLDRDRVFSYDAFVSPLIYALIGTVATVITRYDKELSIRSLIIRKIISLFLGVIIGAVSGYFGGAVDMVIQRIIEVLGAIPQIPLWMALSAAIPAGVSTIQLYFYMTIILSFINWTGMARIVRGKFLSSKNDDYVMAARLAGVSTWSIIWKHLVPGFMSYLIVSVTRSIPSSVVGETSMSYLGLGIRSPATSWGVLLQECSSIAVIAQHPNKLIPIIFVTITVMAFNFFGDGLRDAADPYK